MLGNIEKLVSSNTPTIEEFEHNMSDPHFPEEYKRNIMWSAIITKHTHKHVLQSHYRPLSTMYKNVMVITPQETNS